MLCDNHGIDPIIEEQEMRFSSETPPHLTESPSARGAVQEKTLWGFVSYLIRGDDLGVPKTGQEVEPSRIILASSKLHDRNDDNPVITIDGTVEVPQTVLSEAESVEEDKVSDRITGIDDSVEPSQMFIEIQSVNQMEGTLTNPDSSPRASADPVNPTSDWVAVSERLSMDRLALEVDLCVPDSSCDDSTKLPLEHEVDNHLVAEGVDKASEMQPDISNGSEELHGPSFAESSGTHTIPDIEADASASGTGLKSPTANDRGTGYTQELFASAFSALSFPESVESSEERSDGSITLKQEEEVQEIDTRRAEVESTLPEAPERCVSCGRRAVIARKRCFSI